MFFFPHWHVSIPQLLLTQQTTTIILISLQYWSDVLHWYHRGNPLGIVLIFPVIENDKWKEGLMLETSHIRRWPFSICGYVTDCNYKQFDAICLVMDLSPSVWSSISGSLNVGDDNESAFIICSANIDYWFVYWVPGSTLNVYFWQKSAVSSSQGLFHFTMASLCLFIIHKVQERGYSRIVQCCTVAH